MQVEACQRALEDSEPDPAIHLAAMVASIGASKDSFGISFYQNLCDRSKPDGHPRQCLDTSRPKKESGSSAQIILQEALQRTIESKVAWALIGVASP